MIELRGSAFEACWSRPLQAVETENRRGAGTSLAARVDACAWPELGEHPACYVKRQSAFTCNPPWRGFLPTPTLRRELRALALAHAHRLSVPHVLAYGEGSGHRALLVVEAISDARALDDALAALPAAAADERERLLVATGALFAALHAARIRHGALYPKHVLVSGSDDGATLHLIDFEKARRVATPARAAAGDLPRFFRRASALGAADRDAIARGYAAAGGPANAFARALADDKTARDRAR